MWGNVMWRAFKADFGVLIKVPKFARGLDNSSTWNDRASSSNRRFTTPIPAYAIANILCTYYSWIKKRIEYREKYKAGVLLHVCPKFLTLLFLQRKTEEQIRTLRLMWSQCWRECTPLHLMAFWELSWAWLHQVAWLGTYGHSPPTFLASEMSF